MGGGGRERSETHPGPNSFSTGLARADMSSFPNSPCPSVPRSRGCEMLQFVVNFDYYPLESYLRRSAPQPLSPLPSSSCACIYFMSHHKNNEASHDLNKTVSAELQPERKLQCGAGLQLQFMPH